MQPDRPDLKWIKSSVVNITLVRGEQGKLLIYTLYRTTIAT